VPKGQDNPEP